LRHQGARFDPARTGTTKQPQGIAAALRYAHFTAFTPACRRILARNAQRGSFVAIGKKYLTLPLGRRVSREGSNRI
jgi:hypothetical protein